MTSFSEKPQAAPDSPLFSPRAPEPTRGSAAPWVIAGVVVLALVAALLIAGRHAAKPAPGAVLPADPYAASLAISGVEMSESESLSGGKSTYIDGRVRNNGDKTVTGATVQVLFGNDSGMPPQVETVPLNLVRTREPYIDTQPLSADPLGPGQEKEFRLIFEGITENWNQQIPEIRTVRVSTR